MGKYIKSCFCCRSKDIHKLIYVKKFPYFTAPIDIKSKSKILNSNKKNNYFDNLNLKYCKKCSHVFLSKLPNLKIINELYSKYYNYPSAMLENFVPSRDLEFLNFFKKYLNKKKVEKTKSFYEIGCYDGYVLYNLRSEGYTNISGCDPSSGADIGKKFGIKIDKAFFSVSKKNIKYKKFDYIIARHLVEHLENPKKFFNDLKKISVEKTKVIIEVPNGEFYIKNGLLEVFSHQHIHLFSRYSMSMLIKHTNFFIEDAIISNANLYFILSRNKINKIFVKQKSIKLFIKNYKSKIVKIEKNIKKFKNKKITFYGAGGFCCAAIHLYKIKKKTISSIVDSDHKKINKEFLDINLKVIPSKNFDEYKNNLIIVTSYYTTDIIKSLKKNKFPVNVLAIHPRVMLYKFSNGKQTINYQRKKNIYKKIFCKFRSYPRLLK